MTDLVEPGETGATARSTATGHAWWKNGVGPWIVPGADIAGEYTPLDPAGLNAFAHTTTSGLTVTFDPGEAYLAGWLCRDRSTEVTLPASSTTTVAVGYNANAVLGLDEAPADNENIILDVESAFGDADPRTPIYEFTTDASSVTATTDHRQTEQPVSFDPVADRVAITSGLDVSGALDVGGDATVTGALTADGAMSAGGGFSPGGTLALGQNYLTFEDFSNAGNVFETFANNAALRARDPNGLTVLVLATGGDVKVSNGLIDNSGGDGVQLPDVNGTLPSGTEPGRMVYDSTREEPQ